MISDQDDKLEKLKPKFKMEITKCAITGYDLKPGELKPALSTTIEYETYFVGKVKIGLQSYT